ncbi:MAG: phosphate propanoyltransferase [Candidatus Merdousia sp.]|nr:phosphate propanoyltransferase [Candidatus Merdousia sp.]
MNLYKDTPRTKIEQLVRETVYKELNLPVPHPVEGPNPLVVNVSARHVHLTQEAVEALFGKGYQLNVHKWLYQKGQFAAKESITLIGPRSRVISNLRILGPCRKESQVELALTDARALGFDVPLRNSGDLKGTPGCMLMGPAGFYEMPFGVIRAARHVHMSPADAEFYGVKDKDMMKLRVYGENSIVFENLLCRVDPALKLEVHIDTDEGNACDLNPHSLCELVK